MYRELDRHQLGIIHFSLAIADSLLRSVTALATTDSLEGQHVRARAWSLLWDQIDATHATLRAHGRFLGDLDRARARRGSILLVAANFAAPTAATRAAAADCLKWIREIIGPDIRRAAPPPPPPTSQKPEVYVPRVVFIALAVALASHLIVIALR